MSRLWCRTALLPAGWAGGVRFTFEAGRIAKVETGVSPDPEDDLAGIAVPGLPNVHSHTFQRAMAGLAERRGGPGQENFWTWREQMYRSLDRMDPPDIEAVAAQAFVEMLESGFTRVGEFHYLHHDPSGKPYANLAETAERIASAAQATGIGLTLLPVFYAHGGFGGLPPTHGQRRFINDVDSFAQLMEASERAIASLEGSNIGIAPHSLRAVTPEELKELLPLAKGQPIHIHVAEQTREVDDCLAWSRLRPVQWLLENMPVDDKWCLIHATHTTETELQGIVKSGAVAGLCPITEANLGDGIFDASEFLGLCGSFGVGTDSNVLIDAACELRQLEYAQRLARRERNVLSSSHHASTGRRLWDGALAGGSRSLGIAECGLKEGASADIVTLDQRHPLLAHKSDDAILDAWLFACREGAVQGVWRAGKKVVAEGMHMDREAIAARYRSVLKKLM